MEAVLLLDVVHRHVVLLRRLLGLGRHLLGRAEPLDDDVVEPREDVEVRVAHEELRLRGATPQRLSTAHVLQQASPRNRSEQVGTR